jgi:hypothetical protein
MAEFVIGAVIFSGLALGLLYIASRNTPTCTCNRPDCGGGCLKGKK